MNVPSSNPTSALMPSAKKAWVEPECEVVDVVLNTKINVTTENEDTGGLYFS